VSLTEKGRELEENAYKCIPGGMGEKFKACPLEVDDYVSLARQLDNIIETLKNK
jgi:hypothetical protein